MSNSNKRRNATNSGGSKYRRSNTGGAVHISLPPRDTDMRINTPHTHTSARYKATTNRVETLGMSSSKWKKLTHWAPKDNTDYALGHDSHEFDEVLNQNIMVDTDALRCTTQETPITKRSQVSKRPHVVWRDQYRSIYLDELARNYGRGDFLWQNNQCADCMAARSGVPGHGVYRCKSGCFIPDLVCEDCCVRRHQNLPFHIIEKWDVDHFHKVSLKSLGLRLQLNHKSTTSSCPSPRQCHTSFVVLHTNGIHEISFYYCACQRTVPDYVQLLRRRLFPASQLSIQCCATFDLLEQLTKYVLTTKSSIYDFYRGLEYITDGTGINIPKCKYRTLMRMVRQYQHLKMLERSGRALDPTGVEGTQPGDMAVRCLSCPYPGINVPKDLKVDPNNAYLYRPILCMDANFRLKNQMVSNYSQDPGMSDGLGWAYMVPRREYEAYQLQKKKDTDMSTCVGFQAIAQANSRFSQGLRATGVGGVFCGRSEMFMPMGIGTLQKGERYSNMDYIFASAMKEFRDLPEAVISYDIACQWFQNLNRRMSEVDWPGSLKLPDGQKLIPAIPKLHEPMHSGDNHQQYSFNFIPGVGDTDGECPERGWGAHNAIGPAISSQGPGSYADTIDVHFGYWNWLKTIGTGDTLARRWRAAVANRNLQNEAHKCLSSTVSQEFLDTWESACVAWEAAVHPKASVFNPYEIKEEDYLTESAARKELAKQEQSRLSDGGSPSIDGMTPLSFIDLALQIEDMQRRLRRAAKKTLPLADEQHGGLAENRNQLRRRIELYERLTPIFMPGLPRYQMLHPPPEDRAELTKYPENKRIWFPSDIPTDSRLSICIKTLPYIEETMRTAQCYAALNSLRQILKLKDRLVKFKNQHVRGQRDGTRSRAIVDRVHERAQITAEKYRRARDAKTLLGGEEIWGRTLRVLLDADIRGLIDPDRIKPKQGRKGTREDGHKSLEDAEVSRETDNFSLLPEERSKRDGTGATRKRLSWIWLMPDLMETLPPDLKEGTELPPDTTENTKVLQVEWGKSRARAKRTNEEVKLLSEEMRRSLVSLEYQSDWWRSRIGLRNVKDVALADGLKGYATRQAIIRSRLLLIFRDKWENPWDGSRRAQPDITISSIKPRLAFDQDDQDNEESDPEEVPAV